MKFPTPPLPRYGEASLADLLPSLLAALEVPGFPNVLGVEPARRICLLVVDGLGWELVRRHGRDAPFLAGLAEAAAPLTAGFPSSTAVSLASLGTGKTPGEHGLVGYTIAIPGYDRAMNVLRWSLHGTPHVDLRKEVEPERLQPELTVFERAVADGVEVSLVGPHELAHTGLTRAVLRGGRYRPAFSLGDLASESIASLGAGRRALVYSYSPELDLTGHVRGVDSESWRLQLAHVDRLAADVAGGLKPGSLLVVTGDHGMVDVAQDQRVDLGDHPALRHGLRFLGGEPRARHVYAMPGAAGEVLAAWREVLGDRMWVLPREHAIAAGWFGPTVPDPHRSRIGDVVAAAHGPVGVVERAVASVEARMIGHHGSLTAAELLVPMLAVRR